MPEDIGPTLERIKKNFDTLHDRLVKRAAEVSAQDFSEHDFSKLELKAIKSGYDFQGMKRKEIAKLKGKELTVQRKEMLSVMKAELSLAQSVLGNSQGQFFAFTAPTDTENPKHREIRDVLRGIDPEEVVERNGKKVGKRVAVIEAAMQTDRALDYLHALISAPDPIVSPETLQRLRAQYTISHEPKLYESLQYGEYWYREVRELLADYNSKAVRTLMLHEADDPITVAERAEAFPPLTDRDRELTGKRILEEERRKDREEREGV